MAWDPERYRAEVLEPARKAGNIPPPDLYARYGLPRRITDQDLFDRQVDQVVGYWAKLTTQRTYASLTERLITEHANLKRAGRLTVRSFAELQADARKALLARLDSLAESEADTATHVGPAAVAKLRDALGGAVSDDDVRQALGRAGVTIVDTYPALPVKPHPKQADLAGQLAQLGLRLSAEVVFGTVGPGFRVLGGFRLADGRTLTETEIAAARGRVTVLPFSDPAKAPRENVLAILSTAARTPGALDDLLLSEVVEWLRNLARLDFMQKAIAIQGRRELGLDANEAGLLAATVLLTGTREALSRQVADELAAGRLRSAERLAVGLPADDPLLERIAAVHAEVASIVQRADGEESRGNQEQAAALLADAIRLAGDDDGLSRRLAAIPPPAPGNVHAEQDGNRMRVSWQPSAATGGVHYLVARGRGHAPRLPSEGIAVVTRTEQSEVTDDKAPAGTDLFYSVFAAREGAGEGKAWSPRATFGPAVLTPDIADVSVSYADTSVTMSWRPYPGTDAVHVVRQEAREPRGPDDGTIVDSTLTGFTDPGLRSGTEYWYLIVATYRTGDGPSRRAPGVVRHVVPEPVPRPVTDLDITGPGEHEPTFLATWTRPPYGQVRLVRGDKPSHWRAGASISPAEAATLTEVKLASRPGRDGRDAGELRLPPGLHQVTALTVGRNAVTIGSGADAWLVEPVDGLRAERRQDEVEVSWLWPQGATDALLRWPGGEQRRSPRAYQDEGAATVALTVGPAETMVEVRAVYSQQGREVVSSWARFPVPARGVAVSYQVRAASRLRPREVTFELTAEQAVRLPPLVVVRGTEQDPPGDPYAGEVIARRPPQDIQPGGPVSFTVTSPGGARDVACFVDPAAPPDPASAIVLFPPSAPVTRTAKPPRRPGANCPYCHEEISRRPAWFRCTGEPGPTGKRCPAAVDDVLLDRAGFSGAVFPAFAAPRRDAAAVCPECGGKTAAAICPGCHRRFPVHFREAGSYLIVPVGAKETGKTVFMTVLAHELKHRTGEQLNAALTGADDHTRHDFFSEYESPLYHQSRLPAPTVTAVGRNRPPLVFHFTNERSLPRVLAGPLGQGGLPGNRYPRRTLLSFLDTAGEDLRTLQSMEENVRGLGAADGILLLLDPLQMPGARGLAAPGTRLPALAGDDEPSTVLQNFTDILLTGNTAKRGRRIDRPLAIVFTKMDTLLPSLQEPSPLLRPQPRGRYFDERDSQAVHTEIHRLLARWQGSEIDRIARLNYRTYRYFGVSALGETPTEDNRVSARGIRPYRVTSPMLWLLALFGIIPVK